MAHDVFISYATPNKSIAEAACATLEAGGLRCWIAPRDIAAGSDWSKSIAEAIQGCRAVVVVFSAEANESLYVSREACCGVDEGKVIVPFRIEDVVASGALRLLLATTHWMDAIPPPVQRHLDELLRRLRALLDDPPASPPAAKHMKPESINSAFQAELRKLEWSWTVNLAYGFSAFINLAHGAQRIKNTDYSSLSTLVIRPLQELGMYELDVPSQLECSTARAMELGREIENAIGAKDSHWRAGYTFLWQVMLLLQSDDTPAQHSVEERAALSATLHLSAKNANFLDEYSRSLISRIANEAQSPEQRTSELEAVVNWARNRVP